jgi:starvation-inducible DNA-binding protein
MAPRSSSKSNNGASKRGASRAASGAAMQTFQTRHPLPEEKRREVVDVLNRVLGSLHDLSSQVTHCHWNVKGQEFYQLHEMFERMADEVAEFLDPVAERATALGGFAKGTARMAAQGSELPEFPAEVVDGLEMVGALIERYAMQSEKLEQYIEQTEQADDKTSSDLLIDVQATVDKHLWFLEAHNQR